MRKRDLPCMLLSRAVEVFEYRAIADGAIVWKDKLGMMRLVERLGRWMRPLANLRHANERPYQALVPFRE